MFQHFLLRLTKCISALENDKEELQPYLYLIQQVLILFELKRRLGLFVDKDVLDHVLGLDNGSVDGLFEFDCFASTNGLVGRKQHRALSLKRHSLALSEVKILSGHELTGTHSR